MKSLDKVRAFLLPRLRRGELNMTQAAWIAGISKQAVWRWCERARIDIKRAEHERLMDLRLQLHRWIIKEPIKPALQRRSKAELRKEAIASKIAWDLKHSKGNADGPADENSKDHKPD